MNPSRSGGLRTRMLLLIVLSIIPVLGLLFHMAWQDYQDETARVRDHEQLLARLVAKEHERLINEAHRFLLTLAQLPQVRSLDVDACNKLLSDLHAHFPRYANVGVAAPDGRALSSILPFTEPVTCADREWFQRLTETKRPVMSEYLIGRITKKPQIAFGHPAFDEAGNIAAVVYAAIDLDWLNQFVAHTGLPEGATLTVLDHRGTILARHPDLEGWTGKVMPDALLVKTILTRGEGFFESPGLDGIPRLYTIASLDGASAGSLHIGIGVPLEIAYARVRRVVTYIGWIGLVALLATTAAWFFGNAAILRPVMRLHRAVGAMQAGNLSIRAGPPYTAGQVGHLSRAFDQMADSLEHREAERKKAQEELTSSEETLRSLINANPESLFLTDTEGIVLAANETVARRLGPDVAGLIGRCIYDFLPPDIAEERKRYVEQVISTGKPVRFEDMSFERYLNNYVSPILADHGRPTNVAFLGVDVTELRLAEAMKEQQFQRTALLNEIARSMLARHDMQSVFHIVLKYLEDQLPADHCCVWSYDQPREEFVLIAAGGKSKGHHAAMGLNEGIAIPLDEMGLRACMEGGFFFAADTDKEDSRIISSHSRLGFGTLHATRLIADDKVIGVLFVGRREKNGFSPEDLDFFHTLSEYVSLAAHQAHLYDTLKKAYDDLRQTQDAVLQQERLRAIGQMASGIVHDINNALGPIVGYTDMLLEYETGLSDNIRHNLKMIKAAGADIAHIAAGLRNFYRKRDERDSLQPLSLNRLVTQVIDLTRPRWRDMPQEHGVVIDMQTDLHKGLPLVGGVESEMREAITNLILNAADAMPQGGTLTLRTSALASGHVLVEVIDTGTGMDEETRRRCLEPFYTTKGKQGTGLGLAMVYGMIRRHEGDIEIASELGRGTTVRLVFPVREVAYLHPGASPVDAPHRPLRVLCIDDEPRQRGLMKDMLEKDKHRVWVAAGGQAGIDLFREARDRGEPFDVIITDLGMPYVDGRVVATTVKNEAPETPVILLTGWGERMNSEGNIPPQVDYVLGKPPTVSKIRGALQQVVRSCA